MKPNRERRKKWNAKDYGWAAAIIGALAAFVIYSAFDTYNSPGGYDSAIRAYSEHGDATLGFVMGGILALVAVGCGLVAANAKGSQLGSSNDG